MVAEEIEELVSDSTDYFYRDTYAGENEGYQILDTHCTRRQLYLRKRAYRWHILKNGLGCEATTPWIFRATSNQTYLCCGIEGFVCYHDAKSG